MQSDLQAQIQELEAKIQKLRSNQFSELQAKLAEAKQTVADLEAEISRITGKSPTVKIRVKRAVQEDVRGLVLKALSTTREGLSQKEISVATQLNYGTVAVFLKKNSKDFKTTGNMRSKRYFLR